MFLGKGVSSWQPRKKVISVHLCQGATCPGLEAAFVIYLCSFSVSFLSQGQGGCVFSRRLLSSVRLWSEQERWYLKAEDVQACSWVGSEGVGILTGWGECFGGNVLGEGRQRWQYNS